MANKSLYDLRVSFDGTNLHFVDRETHARVASLTPFTNGTTTITVTSTSATSLYTGASSAMSATAGTTGLAVFDSNPPQQ